MKFSIESYTFATAIDEVIKGVAPKSTLPVLEHIHLKLNGNKLTLVSTDQDVTIRTVCDVIGFENGGILVPAMKLNELIKMLKGNNDIEFNVNKTAINIKSGKDSYDFNGINESEYLELPELENEAKAVLNIDRLEFQKAMDVSFCCSNDEFRPAMTGVLLQFDNKTINFVATDSYRLSKYEMQLDNSINAELILPKKASQIMKKINSDVSVSLIGDEIYTHIKFTLGNTEVISRLIAEKYPPYKSVIPTNNEKYAVVDKSNLLKAVKKASIMTSKHSKQLTLTFNQNSLEIKGQDEDSGNNAVTSLDCESNVSDFKFGFNYQYLIDAIDNSHSDNNIKFTFNENTKPCLIENNNQLMLIMPVRLS